MPIFCNKTVDYDFYNAGGLTAEPHGRTAKTANIGIAIDKFPDPQSSSVWKTRFKNPVIAGFWFSIGCYVVDQGSGDG